MAVFSCKEGVMPRTGRKENLKPVKSVEEAREKGAKGGKKSGEVRRKNKSLREALRFLLQERYEYAGETVDGFELLAIKTFEQAQNGSVKAFEVIRDSIGEKPTEVHAFEEGGVQDIQITFVDKSDASKKLKGDPKIVGESSPTIEVP